MITPAVGTRVSRFHIILVVGATAMLGACAASQRAAVGDMREVMAAQPATIRFENEGEQLVDVYLVGERQEWRLGRVAPGAIARLEIPPAALVESAAFVRLAVIEGGPRSVQAARDPRAQFSIAQPVGELRRQRFEFRARQAAGGQLVELRADGNRR